MEDGEVGIEIFFCWLCDLLKYWSVVLWITFYHVELCSIQLTMYLLSMYLLPNRTHT